MKQHTPQAPSRWRAVAEVTGLLAANGTVQPTIFSQMSALAARSQAVNLGQGFPDSDGPDHIKALVKEAIDAGHNQYPPAMGIAELRTAIARHQRERYGIHLDPAAEVMVTTGATEALTAAILALTGPGDEVVTFEPFYDSYPAAIAMSGAKQVTVPLTRRQGGFHIDFTALEQVTSDRTRMLVLNTPHNPTGMVIGEDELAALSRWAIKHDVLVLSDEVYEHLTYDDAIHRPIAGMPAMASRTLTVSSSGKSFSFTGWKIGWVTGPADLLVAVQTVKQYLTFASGAPFQPAIAAALNQPELPAALASDLAGRRDLLCDGLLKAGFEIIRPQGTYFVVADIAPLGYQDARRFCEKLPAAAGVAAIPVSALCRPGASTPFDSLVRFTFVKDEATLRTGVERLLAFARSGAKLA
ncbi:N-succinyldiaminopimelate aminotransferase [Micrococcales bacterium KH10]|nr:N-succinyldiaminopimelate aminotransferase [Micrococcales bacterium KH10]